ncbi:TadE/TadG family type IV pilus assembly protein [Sphingomonas mali]|uniref:TadE/TadG family type IV pilus assembly protein n=1 Tax=Sphingomonas mali TaxID=40682 RepID=UPI000836301C|nr:TadE/TadG family type IV pilus assembly protein [Sphingomonas mali]
MIRRRFSIASRALACRRGSAAVEMALVTPMFLILGFGSVDLGNYFLSEHAVLKGVRDGARYASRRYPVNCVAVTTDTSAIAVATQNLVRTNTIDGTGAPRLNGWSSNTTIVVSVACNTNATYRGGIYTASTAGAPVVSVTATVPYPSLFKAFGITKTTINLNATAQAAVVGA